MNVKKLYGVWLSLLSKTLGVDAAKNFDSILRFHRCLNLKNPKTLADKVSYIELHCQSPLAPLCTDKLAVRDYVVKKGLSEILIPLVTSNMYGNGGGKHHLTKSVSTNSLSNSYSRRRTAAR